MNFLVQLSIKTNAKIHKFSMPKQTRSYENGSYQNNASEKKSSKKEGYFTHRINLNKTAVFLFL